jgi:hypothetical protein
MKAAVLAAVALLPLAACNSNPLRPERPAPAKTAPAPRPAAPKPVEAPPPAKAEEAPPAPRAAKAAEARLSDGVTAYENGDYKTAQQELQGAVDQGLPRKLDKVKGYKYLAFIACAGGDRQLCKEHFLRAFAVDARFHLTKTEAGHPIWGPVFREARAEARRKAAKN